MKLIIKPHSKNFSEMIGVGNYNRLWEEHGEDIIKAFYEVTGLRFAQPVLRARVFNDRIGHAGRHGVAIHLPARYFVNDEEKFDVLIHELSHRLLSGWGIESVRLGLVNRRDRGDLWVEYEHRFLYLFEELVIEKALGMELANRVRLRHVHDLSKDNGAYGKAYRWASSLREEQRATVIQRLASYAVPRKAWDVQKTITTFKRVDAERWFKGLVA